LPQESTEEFVRIRIEPMGRVPIAGEIAQEFELPDSTRAPRRLSELISHGRLVLIFYRGNW
jgi:peroxiredoxin